jgi:hypothetical protein
LLLGPGDGGGAWADILVGLWGNTERSGEVGLVLPEAFLTRNGFVSELVDVDCGSTSEGVVGSSNGDTTATQCQQQESRSDACESNTTGCATVGGAWDKGGSVLETAEAADDGFVAAAML